MQNHPRNVKKNRRLKTWINLRKRRPLREENLTGKKPQRHLKSLNFDGSKPGPVEKELTRTDRGRI